MPRIFISYSHKDRTVAKRLVDSLRSAYGYSEVWFDENLSAGQIWREELLTQIVGCDVFLFLISPDSIQSDYCKKEIAHAQGARKPIIPLMVRTTPKSDLSHDLRESQILDISSGISTPRFANLQNAIQLATQKAAPPPQQTTPNIGGDYMSVGSISGSGIGKQVIDKQINNYTNIPRIIIFIILLLIGLVALFVIINRPQATPPDPTVAYEFLVDTSDNMLELLNGIPRYEIVNQAIRQIANAPGLDTSRTYRAVRFAGGGTQCDQTQLVARGTGDQATLDEFLLPLSYIPSGENAVEAGIRATFEDLAAPQVQGSDVKVVFIMLGALDLSPCRDFNIPIALSSYKQLGIATTFCTFSLVEDLPGFERFQREMLDQGFGCVNNVDDPQEISKIALTIIDQLIKEAKGEEVTLTPIGSSTPVSFLRPTNTPSTTPTPQPTATDTVTTAPTATNTPTTAPTDTIAPTDTDTPTTQPTDTNMPTTQPTNTPPPTDTATRTPSNTPTPEPTDTPTKTATRRPSPTPSNTPTRTPSPTRTPNLRATQTRVAQIQQTNEAQQDLFATQTATNRPPTRTPRPTATPTRRPSSTPRPTSTPEPITITVSVASANIRSGPGTNYSLVATAVRNAPLTVIAQNGVAGDRWYLVVYGSNQRGWISDQVVSLGVSVNQIPTAATIPPTPNTGSSSGSNGGSTGSNVMHRYASPDSEPYRYEFSVSTTTYLQIICTGDPTAPASAIFSATNPTNSPANPYRSYITTGVTTNTLNTSVPAGDYVLFIGAKLEGVNNSYTCTMYNVGN